MRLNGATVNGRRLNAGSSLYPVTFSADSIGVVASVLDAVRYANSSGAATAITLGDFQASAQRYLVGDLASVLQSDLAAHAVRSGAGSAIATCHGELYYTRTIYGTGGAEIQIIAISDVGVEYGSGEGIAIPTAAMDGTRVRTGAGDAVAAAIGGLNPSAIRIPATRALNESVSILASLDSARITGGGIRYIDGFGGAYAYLELKDDGFRRQIFIGSLDLEPLAYGSATATRNGRGDAAISATASAAFEATRRGEGSGVIAGVAELAGEVFVRGSGDAVINIVAQLTGYVYRRGGVLDAISTLSTELVGVRKRPADASAPLVCTVSLDGRRVATGSGTMLIELNAQSTASDFNFVGMDDDSEIFYRPAMQREFSRNGSTREWRRL